MSRRKQMPVTELIRRAILSAIDNQEELISCYEGAKSKEDLEFVASQQAFVDQMRLYYRKRWGKSQRDKLDEQIRAAKGQANV